MTGAGADNAPDGSARGVPQNLLSQAEIDAAMAAMQSAKPIPTDESPLAVEPVAPLMPREHLPVDLGFITQAEIDRAIGKRESAVPVEPQSDKTASLNEIDQLLAAAEAEPTNFAAAEAALQRLDQEDVNAFRDAQRLADKVDEPALGLDSPQDGTELLSQGELDSLLTAMDPDTPLANSELDALLASEEAIAQSNMDAAIRADAAPITLGENELEALLGAHPLVREEPPSPLPIAREQVEEDPLDRATRETTAANVGLENLAAAVPSTEASDQPLEQDLIDSLVAQAAQAAAQPAPPTRDIPAAGGGAEPQRDSHLAMGLSDDDFDDIGMPGAAPATLVSEPADEPKSTEELGESPVVERRLTRRPALPRKLVASIAASLLVGGGALLFFWPKAKEVEVPAATETHDASLELEDVIIIAKELMGKGEYVAAMKQLGTAIRKSEPGPLLNEARFLHVEAGYRSLPPNPRDVDTETVLKNIEDVIGLNEKYSRNPEALMWKADLYKRTGSPTTARATYERILSSYASAPNIDQVLLEHARLSFDLKYFDDAITNFKRVVEELPQSPHKSEAQMLLAKSYEQTGRIPEAEAQYAAVAAERTDSRVGAEAALALARLAKAANDLPRAIQALEARLQTATTVDGNDGVYVELAKAYRATGKPIDAVRIARELISFFPESPHVPEAAVELTRALEATGDRGQALELAQQAAERFDKNPDVLRNRAQLLAKSGDTRGAADALVKADELGADDPAVLLEAAQKYVELNGVGDASKAETLLKSILERFPKSTQAVDASVSLARLEYERGELAAAIDRLSALASGDHDQTQDLAIQSALGGIYSELGLKKRATAAYEKVAALTSDPELLAQAATALLKNGAIGSALPVIRKFDAAQLSSKTGFDLLMAQGRALLDIDPEQALGKMQQAFESYPVERTPEDYEYLVRACVETGKTAHVRVLVSDFNTYVQSHPEESPRLQRTATLWGDALYKSGDYRAALDAYALVAPPEISPVPMPGEEPAEAEAEPAPLPADVLWAKYQRANAMLKLDDYWNSVPILESLAETESPYAEDARLKAEYARLEQRLRNETPPSAGG